MITSDYSDKEIQKNTLSVLMLGKPSHMVPELVVAASSSSFTVSARYRTDNHANFVQIGYASCAIQEATIGLAGGAYTLRLGNVLACSAVFEIDAKAAKAISKKFGISFPEADSFKGDY